MGYEGQPLESFVDALVAAGYTALVDVRLNALSRKPGFSKRGHREALAEAGIEYQHRPSSATPRTIATASALRVPPSRRRERGTQPVSDERAAAAIEELASAGTPQLVALKCFEADDARCHRQVILSAVDSQGATAAGRRPRARLITQDRR
jgi:uncharacterized protein (DUF488 family)